jgi:two-component sensor histidine kinase
MNTKGTERETVESDTARLLSRELDHRVFNNLQMISSLLDIQLHDTVSPQGRRALKIVQSRLKSISLVNEFNIAAGGTGILDAVDLAAGFATIMVQTHSSPSRKLSISCLGPSRLVSVNTAMPLVLIASEFVNAAIETGKSTGEDTIEINWRIDPPNACIAMRSGGRGIGPSGMKLIEAMARQICMEARTSKRDGRAELKLAFMRRAATKKEP